MATRILGRLKALERTARRPEPKGSENPQGVGTHRRTDAEWLAAFEGLGAEGFFAGEPDFPVAIEAYREAVRAATDRGDSTWDLPEWSWLAEMFERVDDGKPPVTEAEFLDLAEWFEAHVPGLTHDRGAIDLGDQRSISAGSIRQGIKRGARAPRATEVAEQLRELRDRFGSPA